MFAKNTLHPLEVLLDSSNILGAMLGSGISGESNNNANSRAAGGR